QGLDHAGKTMFLAAASETFRRVLVDYARSNKAKKRGGGAPCVSIDESSMPAAAGAVDAAWLHELLEVMAKEHPRRHQIVQLKCFGGLEVAQIAEVLGVSERTVASEW